MKKKSYNPFKLWGSYLGAIIPIIVFPLIRNSFSWFNGSSGYFDSLIFISKLPAFYLLIILGFLVGWGIHSLFRKISK